MRDLRKVRPLPRSASDNTIYNGKARTKLHRNRTHTVHSGIPGKCGLPNIESQGSSSSILVG